MFRGSRCNFPGSFLNRGAFHIGGRSPPPKPPPPHSPSRQRPHTPAAPPAGSPAEYPASTSDAALVTAAVNTLRAMFGAANIPEPVQTWVTRWHSDPYSFGSYSSVQPGAKGRERADLAATTAGRLFWAGEATHQRVPATVQGAWLSGAAAAAAAAAAF
jgi:monoamine oxidase